VAFQLHRNKDPSIRKEKMTNMLENNKHHIIKPKGKKENKLSYVITVTKMDRRENSLDIAKTCSSNTFQRLCCQSVASYSAGSASRPGQSMWDSWCTKWHSDRFLSESFGFPLSVSFHRCSTFTRVSSGGWAMAR
jgi:hypothetical protein